MNSDRRGFLRWVIGGSATIIAAITALPGIGYMLSPALSRGQRKRHKVVFKTPADAESRKYVEARWDKQEETSPGLFVRKEGDHYAVLWARCPHASCAVEWKVGENQFVCPCHQGRFDSTGKNVAGPPPRPLERLNATIVQGELFIEEPEA